MRLYYLERVVDNTGVSGTGVVAEICEFTDGHVAMRWLVTAGAGIASWYLYDSLQELIAVHGHSGNSRVISLE